MQVALQLYGNDNLLKNLQKNWFKAFFLGFCIYRPQPMELNGIEMTLHELEPYSTLILTNNI